MKLENEFTVPAPIDQAWAVLLDVPRVAPCLPGATVEPDQGEDGEYRGQMKVKIGPITASYKGTVKIQEADEAAHRVAMRAQAKDARGQGTAAATITSTMEEVAEGTKVSVVTDMRVTGPAAQFGRGVMQDVSAKLMTRFADCLATKMQAAPEEELVPAAVAAEAPEPEAAAAEPEAAPAPEAEVEAAAPEAEAAPEGEAAAAPEAEGEAPAPDAEAAPEAVPEAEAAALDAETAPEAVPEAEAAAPEAEGEAPAPDAEAAPEAEAPAPEAAAPPEAEAPAPEPAAPEPEAPAPEPERPTDDVLDLGELGRAAVLKRAVPLVGALVALLVLIRLIRR